MSVTITLYEYSGENNVVNKFATDIQLIKSLDVELRMPFNPLSPTFTIGEYHKCNYCHFYYHDTFYACYCDITTLSDGLYQVNCYVDSLTTAYQNGSMLGVQCKMLYSKFGEALVPDNRLAVTGSKSINEWDYDGLDGTYYVLQIASPYSRYYRSPSGADYKRGYGVSSNVDIFILTKNAFNSFWTHFFELNEPTRNAVHQSILSVSVFHYMGTPVATSDGAFRHANSIPLYGLINTAPENAQIVQALVEIGNYQNNAWSPAPYEKFHRDITVNIDNIKITPYNDNFKVSLYGIGDVNIKLLDLGIETLSSIGFRIYFDWWSKAYYCELLVNGKLYPAINMTGSVSELCPILMESSINTMRDVYVNGVTRTASAGLNIHKQLTNYIQLGVEYMTRSTDYPNVGTVQGHVGGNPSLMSDRLLHVTQTIVDIATNQSTYNALFGAPDGELRFIGDMQGYFVAEDVHLDIAGLPVAIVNEAESQLKTGVYMV